jgi:hypothetical protein
MGQADRSFPWVEDGNVGDRSFLNCGGVRGYLLGFHHDGVVAMGLLVLVRASALGASPAGAQNSPPLNWSQSLVPSARSRRDRHGEPTLRRLLVNASTVFPNDALAIRLWFAPQGASAPFRFRRRTAVG